MLVLGKKEMEAGTLTVRSRDGKQKRDVKPEELEAQIKGMISSRAFSLEGVA
jgi:threonyl-tRNA synthetase